MSNNLDFNHSHIVIEPYTSNKSNKKLFKVFLKKDSNTWTNFLDNTLEYSKDNKCWFVNTNEIDSLLEMINSFTSETIRQNRDNHKEDDHSNTESDESYSDDESSDDTDDELIQKTLARRLKSESKQLEIEEHHVSDSEYEDVVSITRRLRYLYKYIKNLEHRIHKLEHR
jgi:hypothetical protein